MAADWVRKTGKWKAGAIVAALVTVAAALIVAPALGAFSVLRTFGDTGDGPGRISPHASGIAVGADGRVYVADRKDSRVEAFTNAGEPDGGWAAAEPAGVATAPDGSVVVSGPDGVVHYAADGTELDTLSHAPWLAGLAVAPDGTVYAADPLHGRVLALGTDTVIDGLGAPGAVGVAPAGTVFVADAGTGLVRAFAPDGTPLQKWPASDPRGITVTPDGTVLVVDSSGARVDAFDQFGKREGSFGSGLNVPFAVASDCRGSAYVVDNSSKRVAVYGDAGDPPPCPPPAKPTPTPSPSPSPTAAPPAPPTVAVLPEVVADEDPILGVRGRVTPVSGTVLVAKKGQGYRKLDGTVLLPVGSSVDATAGHVKLEFESDQSDRPVYGRFMSGEFYDGSFEIDQGRTSSLVDLKLLDEGSPTTGRRATAAAKKGLKVWGKAKGRFRTQGRNGAATVRGTHWLTQEKPEGTYFEVAEGVVAVQDFRTGKTHLLHAGDSYLATPTCVSRRSFRIRLRVPPGAKVRSAVVKVDGKRVAVRIGKRVTAPIDLRGVPEGKVAVSIRIRTQDGRVVTGKRLYSTCSDKKNGSVPTV
jgi:hypothetical protein